jgi:hypothetical protein
VDRGRGGEANDEGVEIVEHLAPLAVDRAVALVGDDEVEGLDGDGGVVGDVLGPVVRAGDFVAGFFIEVFVELLAAEHRIKPLDGADGDTADVVEPVPGEVLDVVDSGELSPIIWKHKLIELAFCLPAQIGAVHKEKDPLCPACLMRR